MRDWQSLAHVRWECKYHWKWQLKKGPLWPREKGPPIVELWWSSGRGRTERSDGRPRPDERYCRGTSCRARDAWLRVAALSR